MTPRERVLAKHPEAVCRGSDLENGASLWAVWIQGPMGWNQALAYGLAERAAWLAAARALGLED